MLLLLMSHERNSKVIISASFSIFFQPSYILVIFTSSAISFTEYIFFLA